MTEVKAKAKPVKQANAMKVSIEPSTQEMVACAQQLGIETVFDRAVTMKPCAIGLQGICCKNCASGPCRLPDTKVVKAGGLGDDLCDLPAAGSALGWMSEKAIAIGQNVVSSGVSTVFGYHIPLNGAPVFKDYLYKDMENIYGGKWDCKPEPIKHVHKLIAHIDKKGKELGIDKARDRVLMDMADRQALGVE